MRHKGTRAIFSLSIFGIALFIVLALNFGGRRTQQLPWTFIQYREISDSLPPANGICPGLDQTEKPALVVSRVEADGDAAWVNALEDKYHLCIYNVDAAVEDDAQAPSQQLRVPANRGHEAMTYLTFLIDNYPNIPAAGAVFVHGSRFAWHNDDQNYDNKALLAELNVSAALEQNGYHNLRCDWSAGTCGDSYSWEPKIQPQGSYETKMTAALEPYNKRAVSDAALPGAFATLFSNGEQHSTARALLGRHDTLRAQCCAQFVVSPNRIWQHTQQEYVALRQWLLDEGVAHHDDRVVGRILSYMWHVLFLPQLDESASDPSARTLNLDELNSLACPNARECYCRLYGRCNLETCTSGHCSGQYSLPRDYKLPNDWADTHI